MAKPTTTGFGGGKLPHGQAGHMEGAKKPPGGSRRQAVGSRGKRKRVAKKARW